MSWRCVQVRISVSKTHTPNKMGSGSQISRTMRIAVMAAMTDQPAGVNKVIPITAPITPGREAFQSVNPIHIPSVDAIAFPPRKPRNGEKVCPRMGAMAMSRIGNPRIPRLK